MPQMIQPNQFYRLKFIVDEPFAQQLKFEAARDPDNLKVESEREEKDATRLGFDLGTAVAIVTIVQGALYAGELAVKIYQWWQASRANKVVLQTPFQTLELHKSAGITEADIRKFLKAAQAASK